MPDHGLSSVFKPVKFLGRGGTGDTWLYETLVPTAGVPISAALRGILPECRCARGYCRAGPGLQLSARMNVLSCGAGPAEP